MFTYVDMCIYAIVIIMIVLNSKEQNVVCVSESRAKTNTVWLQISMVEYFRDFREFRYDHENFCYEIFLTAAPSTALDTSKSRKTSESRKSGKITKV